MKSRKILALFLAIFMLASLIVPASATDVNVESTSGAGFSVANINVTEAPADAVSMSAFKVTVENETTGESETKYFNYAKTNTSQKNYKIENLDDLITFANVVKIYNNAAYYKTIGVKKDGDNWVPMDATGDTGYMNFQNLNVYLTADIDCSSVENFEPIGGWGTGISDTNQGLFYGKFYGCGHTIKNLTMDATKTTADKFSYGALALFRGVSSSYNVIQDLIIDSSCKFIGEGSAAAVVGFSYNGGKVVNVWNQASVTGGGLVGGVFAGTGGKGNTGPNLDIKNCTNTGEIKSTSSTVGKYGVVGVGGILGSTDQIMYKSQTSGLTITVENCLNLGKISTTEATIPAGGIIGGLKATKTASLTITNCVNYGDVSATKTNGICGDSAAGGSLTITANTNNTDYSNTKGDMLVSFYQTSNEAYTVDGKDGDHYSLRIIATHNNIENYKSFSYNVSIKYGTEQKWEQATESQSTVYSAINVTEGENTYPIQATACGAEYFSAVSINNIPVSAGDLTVTVEYTIVDLNGTDVVKTVVFTVPASTLYPAA